MNQDLSLSARVIARNRANANAMALYDLFSKALAPFVGQKIEKVDRAFLAKVRAVLPKMTFFFYRYPSIYSVSFVAKESEMLSDGYSCVYEEALVYVGDVSNGVLVKLYDRPAFRTDYTVAEVQELRNQLSEARKAVSTIKSKLNGFGEYDR